uniref:transposase n=1 Tax=Limnoglobus roseus TaxID=2598579 RepID=UPI00223AA69E|nr:transposase [Limnoglobus roseus]
MNRLRDYAALFAPAFPRAKPAQWAGVYLHGLLTVGDRKSVEPLSRQVALPDGLAVRDPEQGLQQFVSQSPWDERPCPERHTSQTSTSFRCGSYGRPDLV